MAVTGRSSGAGSGPPDSILRLDAEKDSLGFRIGDRLVEAFAVWTLAANLVVLGGGSLRLLIWVGAAALVTLVVAWRIVSRVLARQPRSERSSETQQVPPARDAGSDAAWRIGVGLTALAVALWWWARDGTALAVWWTGLVLSVGIALRELALAQRWAPAAPPSRANGRLFALGLVCALVVLFVHRPNTDDAVYVHIAVAAADHPASALFATDTLHGLPTPSPILDLYRAQSFELMQGALALLTRIPAIEIAHLYLPVLLGFFLPYAHARLLRWLVPGRWFWAVLLAVIFLLTVGDTIRNYSSHGLVRLVQGKTVFLSLAVPLLFAHGLEFARAPGAGRWLRLAATQVACVGLTSSAFWLAPAITGTALVAACAGRPRGVRTLLLGVASSGYLVVLGLLLLRGVDAALLSFEVQEGELHAVALASVLGKGPTGVFSLFCLLGGAWALADSALLRRLCAALGLGFFGVFWNPFLCRWLAEHVTGASTYWRVLWLLPLPILAACVLTAPLAWRARAIGAFTSAALAAALFLAGPRIQALSRENEAWIGRPSLKVPPDAYAAAALLSKNSRPGAFTLAPYDVCPWITTVHGHPVPLMVRPLYFKLMQGALAPEEIERRKELELIVSANAPGTPPRPGVAANLRAAVRDYPLESVCLDRRAASAEQARRALEDEGFAVVERTGPFEIWHARGKRE